MFIVASNVVVLPICFLLSKFRIAFAETFMLASITVRSIGLFLLARTIKKFSCSVTNDTMTLRYAPIYLFHAEVLLFRTNLFSVLIAIQVIILFSGFINYEIIKKQDTQTEHNKYSYKNVIVQQLIFSPGVIPLLLAVYF